jgi:hypothetical protein
MNYARSPTGVGLESIQTQINKRTQISMTGPVSANGATFKSEPRASP